MSLPYSVCRHFGMELDGAEFCGGIFDCADSIGGAAGDDEALREADDVVAMAIPDFEAARDGVEELGFAFAFELGAAVLAALGFLDVAAESVGHPLHAVADAEDGNAEAQDFGIADGGVFIVDGTGAAGEDDADGVVRADVFDFGVAGEDGGEDFELADAAGDELGVLAAEIEDDDALLDVQICSFGAFEMLGLRLR